MKPLTPEELHAIGQKILDARREEMTPLEAATLELKSTLMRCAATIASELRALNERQGGWVNVEYETNLEFESLSGDAEPLPTDEGDLKYLPPGYTVGEKQFSKQFGVKWPYYLNGSLLGTAPTELSAYARCRIHGAWRRREASSD